MYIFIYTGNLDRSKQQFVTMIFISLLTVSFSLFWVVPAGQTVECKFLVSGRVGLF